MKKFFKTVINVILYIWQILQNLVGLIVKSSYQSEKIEIDGITVNYCNHFPGGISLGNTIMVGSRGSMTAHHEHGHQIQSMILGPLYLFVIGIPSLLWAAIYGTKLCPRKGNNYYKFYTEKWADKLGGVERQ